MANADTAIREFMEKRRPQVPLNGFKGTMALEIDKNDAIFFAEKIETDIARHRLDVFDIRVDSCSPEISVEWLSCGRRFEDDFFRVGVMVCGVAWHGAIVFCAILVAMQEAERHFDVHGRLSFGRNINKML